MAKPANTDPPKTQPVWRRLHRSSYIFTGGLAVILLLVNVPGQIVVGPDISSGGKYGPHFDADEHCEHGWPAVWLEREPVALHPHGIWSLRLSPWRLDEGVERFNTVGLLVDLVTAIAIVLIGGAVFELWRRRRPKLLQLQLGELLVLVALSAVCAAVLAAQGRRHQRELELLQLIEDTPDASAEWAIPVSERADRQPGGPSWLQDLVDLEWFRRFDRVVGIAATGEELKHAVQLRNLKVVRLVGGVSNDDLQALEQCSQLEALDVVANLDDPRAEAVDYDEYSGESYFRLPALPKLRGLNMYETSFRGEGLEHLVAIEVLDLTDTDLDDEALARLAGSTRLKSLSLAGTKIGNDGLRHIADLTELEELWLSSTEIDNQGLLHLANLRKLTALGVSNTGLTDAAVPILKRFTRLEYLELNVNVRSSTRLTERGLRELQKALPNCYIVK